ncbi:MAG TPA: TIM barrel protein [Pirellulales bacterium]
MHCPAPRQEVPSSHSQAFSRRQLLGGAAAGAVAVGASLRAGSLRADEPVATKGNIKQSLVQWCYKKYWNIDEMCRVARQLGCPSIELADPADWPTLKKHGLVCAIAGSHGFEKGMNNPAYHEMCLAKMRASIDACAEYGYPNVITFTGFRENIPDDVGLKNCVEGYKKIVGYAEKKNVTLCLEMLNSRATEEMKGHPGYQGDHTDYCMEILREVGSPRLKLLFDIYHVQIMDGDVIVRLRQYADFIAHVHTAGNPGRRELDDEQEINYPPIMRALVEIGYQGYVGQEFIPTRDPLDGLRQAVALCDV